jgi:hypothetical protein
MPDRTVTVPAETKLRAGKTGFSCPLVVTVTKPTPGDPWVTFLVVDADTGQRQLGFRMDPTEYAKVAGLLNDTED